VIDDDDDHEEPITDVVVLVKACQQIAQVGLTLAEVKFLLAAPQQRIVERQTAAFLATCMHCQTWATVPRTKGQHARTFRTFFGTITLMSPLLCSCQCTPHRATTFSLLMVLLSEQTAPELLFMETKWASLVSYGLKVQALTDFLPVDETLSISTVRTNALAVAQRCEAELGDEQRSFIEGCRRDWDHLPIPDGPLTVGINGR